MASDQKQRRKIDYSPFLGASTNGQIWWRLEDAIKLAAGYLPIRDDARNLVATLTATSNRVRADERTLLGAFGRARSKIMPAWLLERDDGQYVEAHEFIGWLSQQADVSPPGELVAAIRDADRSRARASPDAQKFESLKSALKGWFDRSLADLPAVQRARVEADFPPLPWDGLTAEQRASAAAQWDMQHNPSLEAENRHWWDFFVRKNGLEERIKTWLAVDAPTASDLAQKESRLAELRSELAQMEEEVRVGRGDDPDRPSGAGASTGPSCTALQIEQHFIVVTGEAANHDWWRSKMRNASDNGLVECRHGAGQRKRGGSLWFPGLVANWLIDRHARGREGLNARQAKAALKKTPGYAHLAEELIHTEE